MTLMSNPRLAEQRISICEQCRHFRKKTRTCGTAFIGNKVGSKRTCGCFMDIKTKLSFSTCPLGKWGNLQVSEEDYKEIKKLVADIDGSVNPHQNKKLFDFQRKYIGGNRKSTNCSPCVKKAYEQMKQIIEEYEK